MYGVSRFPSLPGTPARGRLGLYLPPTTNHQPPTTTRQVRSTGPINNLTRQPIKGRKFGGGIRLGEMERDSLLAHGAAYLLHDRLHACSDYHVADVCTCCGSLLAPLRRPAAVSEVTSVGMGGRVVGRLGR